MKTQNLLMLAGGLLVSSLGFSQKINVTSAAVEFKQKFQPNLMMGKVDEAKTALLNAKKFIDLASENAETKGQSKTLYYKGEIYGAAAQVAMMTGDTTFLMKNFGQDAFEISISSFQESYKMDKKFRPDIDQSVNMQVAMIAPAAEKFYKEAKYAEAGAAFYYVYKVTTAKNSYDTTNLYNAGICFDKAEKTKEAAEVYAELAEVGYNKGEGYALAARSYTKLKEDQKALEILEKGKTKYPTDKTILFELANYHLSKGNNADAEKALNDAIVAEPNNKQLYYTIGTIYTDLGQNEKAEGALKKALEIDPNYTEAMYNLGAHYVTWATDLRNKANEMGENDWQYDVTLEKSRETYKKAIAPLEKYIQKAPNDKNVLLILFQINQNIGNSEKALEYKKRYDEAK